MDTFHGKVIYEEGANPTPDVFGASKKATAEIGFTGENGDYEAMLDKAALKARSVVATMLGKAIAATTTAAPAGEASTDKPKRTTAKKETAAPAADSFPIDGESKPADGGDAENWEVGDEAEAAEDLSDAAMTKIVTDINKKLKKPGEIKEIIKKFNPPGNSPSSLGAIKKEKRSAFLKELRAFAAQA